MAKRISDLTAAAAPLKTYVFEVDDPSGANPETEKIHFLDLNTILLTLNNNWSNLTLVNNWTGSVKMRVDKDGFLEIFYNLDSSAATSDTVVTSIPSSLVPDHIFRKHHYSNDYSFIYILLNSSVFNVGNYSLQTSSPTFVGYFREPLLEP